MQNTSVEVLLWTAVSLVAAVVALVSLRSAWRDVQANRTLSGRNGRSRLVAWQGVRNEVIRFAITGTWTALGLLIIFVPPDKYIDTHVISWALVGTAALMALKSAWDMQTRGQLLTLDAAYRQQDAAQDAERGRREEAW